MITVAVPTASTISVRRALDLLDGDFKAMVDLTFRTPRMAMHIFSWGLFRTHSKPQPWYGVVT